MDYVNYKDSAILMEDGVKFFYIYLLSAGAWCGLDDLISDRIPLLCFKRRGVFYCSAEELMSAGAVIGLFTSKHVYSFSSNCVEIVCEASKLEEG